MEVTTWDAQCIHDGLWQCMGNTWISPSPQIDLGVTRVRGDIRSYQGTSDVQEEVVNSM